MDDLNLRFPERSFGFNPEVDLQEVDQFGFVNLAECYENGIIPSSLDLTDESFNGVQNPGTLISRSQLFRAHPHSSYQDKNEHTELCEDHQKRPENEK